LLLAFQVSQLHAGLCDRVFTVSSANMRAVLTGPALSLSHWDPYAMHTGGCLELYYCNMVEWFWWHSSLI